MSRLPKLLDSSYSRPPSRIYSSDDASVPARILRFVPLSAPLPKHSARSSTREPATCHFVARPMSTVTHLVPETVRLADPVTDSQHGRVREEAHCDSDDNIQEYRFLSFRRLLPFIPRVGGAWRLRNRIASRPVLCAFRVCVESGKMTFGFLH